MMTWRMFPNVVVLYILSLYSLGVNVVVRLLTKESEEGLACAELHVC